MDSIFFFEAEQDFGPNCRLALTSSAVACWLAIYDNGIEEREKETTMATHPDLPTPVTPNLPVEPDEGPSTPPDEPTDPEPPPSVS
ncbi:hypothetical protein [Variovorax sp. ZS18.2.2]|uniref:hypothetical protein n=1 Tax=Variovorax sp. ZS18.2.2 TaxID=2971255 RepID=UPI002151FD4E|nr:hypothetical protein [Variovorax sp. ZS18.2.2]